MSIVNSNIKIKSEEKNKVIKKVGKKIVCLTLKFLYHIKSMIVILSRHRKTTSLNYY